MFGSSTWVLFLGVIVVGFAVGIVSFTAQCCRNAERQQLIPLSWGLTHATAVPVVPSHAGKGTAFSTVLTWPCVLLKHS